MQFLGGPPRPNVCPPRRLCRSGLPARQTAILDANDGAGWDLAASLLRPRQIVTDDNGGVIFLNTGRAPRLTASAAIKHPFMRAAQFTKPASVPAAASSGSAGRSAAAARGAGSSGRSVSRSGSRGERAAAAASAPASPRKAGGGALSSVWGALKGKLFDLEARVMQEATATEVQTNVVQQLRSDVAAGRASQEQLRKEESVLEGMQRGLTASVKEMNSVYGAARGFFSAVLGSSGGSGKSGKSDAKSDGGSSKAAAAAEAQQERQPDKRMPKWAAKEVPLSSVSGAVVPSGQRRQQPQAAPVEEQEEEDGVAAAEAAGAAAGAAVNGFLVSLARLCGLPAALRTLHAPTRCELPRHRRHGLS